MCMAAIKLELHCGHVSSGAVHCSRYTVLDVSDPGRSAAGVVERSDWALADGEPRCPEHA